MLSVAEPGYVGNATRNNEHAREREFGNRAAKTRKLPQSLVPNGCEKPADCGPFCALYIEFHERRDWMAVHAVCSEPVSEGNSLINREFTGKFLISEANWRSANP